MELEKRLDELARRADDMGIYTETRFLTEGEQSLVLKGRYPVPVRLFGLIPEAERCIAVFGDEENWGYPPEPDLILVRIAPKDPKFADAFTHRDFLGAILNLGIKREVLGDLILWENEGYLVTTSPMLPFLQENLSRVRHTAVCISQVPSLPEGAGPRLENRAVVAASQRIDSVVGAVWNLSRSEAKALVEKEKVSIFGEWVTDPSRPLKEGERVSVRGYGRFYFDGVSGETRSGRCRICVRIYV